MGVPIGIDIIAADSSFLREVIARAVPVELAGVLLPCATLEDLILLELEANRPIDIDDVLAIKDAHGQALDSAYLLEQATRLELGDRLELNLGIVPGG